MNSKVLVLLATLVVVAAAGMAWWALRARPPQLPSVALRLQEGELGRFDRASQGYDPLPVGSEVKSDEPMLAGKDGAVLSLSSGGTVAVGPSTAVTRLAGPTPAVTRLRLDSGRLWLHLKAEEQAEVSSFHSLVRVGGGDCEVSVHKDRDNFMNTVVSMWAGQGSLRGGEKLKVERPLAPGLTVRVDDTTVYPVSRFDTSRPDPWQKRQLERP